MRIFIIALFVTALAGAAQAADLAVTVKTAKGEAVRDAVVTIDAPPSDAAKIKFDWPYVLAQKNLMFDPFVLVIPVGADVRFPNQDNVRHQVYSFSPAKKFELKLYGNDQNYVVHFDKAGVVAVGCNIHDSMVAFIRVVDTPFAAKTDAKGQATLHGAPAGQVTLHVWHPYMKAAGNEVVETLPLTAAGGRKDLVVELRTPPDHRHAY